MAFKLETLHEHCCCLHMSTVQLTCAFQTVGTITLTGTAMTWHNQQSLLELPDNCSWSPPLFAS